MSTTLRKEPAFSQAPGNAPADHTSGMQPATASAAIGNRTTAAGTLLAGQDIGRAPQSGYLRVTVTP